MPGCSQNCVAMSLDVKEITHNNLGLLAFSCTHGDGSDSSQTRAEELQWVKLLVEVVTSDLLGPFWTFKLRSIAFWSGISSLIDSLITGLTLNISLKDQQSLVGVPVVLGFHAFGPRSIITEAGAHRLPFDWTMSSQVAVDLVEEIGLAHETATAGGC